MDHFNSRDNEEDIFAIVRQSEGGAEVGGAEYIGAEDGSQFLNESGLGMEVEDEAQMSIECDDDPLPGSIALKFLFLFALDFYFQFCI